MNRTTSVDLQSGILRYRNLTVGDVRPDATTKLYKRMFKGTTRKYIPVKDLTSDNMGRELSAYLINPEYIDKAVLDPAIVSQQLNPAPVIRVIQYSRLTYERSGYSIGKQTIRRTAAIIDYVLKVGQNAMTSIKKMANIAVAKVTHRPFNQTYSINKGMSDGVGRKHATTSGVLIIAVVGIVGFQSMANQQTDTPKPVTSPVNSSVENPIISTGIDNPSQPIPIFNNDTATNSSPEVGFYSQPRNNSRPVVVSKAQTIAPIPVVQVMPSPTVVDTAPSVSTPPAAVNDSPETTVSPAADGRSQEIISEPVISPVTDPVISPETDPGIGSVTQTVNTVIVDTTTLPLTSVTD